MHICKYIEGDIAFDSTVNEILNTGQTLAENTYGHFSKQP